MPKTTDSLMLPTTITGSLPRPAWYTENLGRRAFRDAIADARFREQYTDAVGTFIRDQERAGLDIVTDGDARFDSDVGGMSWFQYPARHAALHVSLEGRTGVDHAAGEIRDHRARPDRHVHRQRLLPEAGRSAV